MDKGQKTLSVVGFVFDEAPRPRPATTTSGCPSNLNAKEPPPPTAAVADPNRSDLRCSSSGGEGTDDESDGVRPADRFEEALIIRKDELPSSTAVAGGGDVPHRDVAVDTTAKAEVAASRRVMRGPAVPSAAMLAAAAAMAAELSEEDEEGAGGFDDLIGPPPPELVCETDAAPQDEREAEVGAVSG